MSRKPNLSDYEISDDDFDEPPGDLLPAAPFVPSQGDVDALRTFMDTGGSVSRTAKVAGRSVSQVLTLVRKPWFREQLVKHHFVPITTEDIGQEVARAAGEEALSRLVGEDYLSTSDLVRLGQLGVSMAKAPTVVTHNSVQVGSINQLDMRGLSLEQLRVLAGGEDEEVIDI